LCADRDARGHQDCWVAIAVEDDVSWKGLQAALGHPSWASDARFDVEAGRLAARDELDKRMAEWCSTRSGDAIVAALWCRGVPVAKVLHPDGIDEIEQHRDRGFLEWVVHPETGRHPFLGFPARLASGPSRLHRRPAPTLGRDNAGVLGQLLGLSSDELSSLAEAGVIGDRIVGSLKPR
jgi:crotonobetainyl-CoA:carnitine CoA-transferase CaiB-like acyl-CoA transferase